jgi:hypothetical protein
MKKLLAVAAGLALVGGLAAGLVWLIRWIGDPVGEFDPQ